MDLRRLGQEILEEYGDIDIVGKRLCGDFMKECRPDFIMTWGSPMMTNWIDVTIGRDVHL